MGTLSGVQHKQQALGFRLRIDGRNVGFGFPPGAFCLALKAYR